MAQRPCKKRGSLVMNLKITSCRHCHHPSFHSHLAPVKMARELSPHSHLTAHVTSHQVTPLCRVNQCQGYVMSSHHSSFT
eukprot:1140528-Pelagomonas_calceolata.AAC.2